MLTRRLLTRRQWLQHSTLLTFAASVPRILASIARGTEVEKDGPVLVVIQLDGGNDGLNTVVPIGNDEYARLRPTLGLKPAETIRLADGVALHGGLRRLADLWESQQLAIVHGVGYPQPDRSHDVSMTIWHRGTTRYEDESTGWLGRALDTLPEGQQRSIQLDAGPHIEALVGRKAHPAVYADELVLPDSSWFEHLAARGTDPAGDNPKAEFLRRQLIQSRVTAETIRDAKQLTLADSQYPGSSLGHQLAMISALLKTGIHSRVYYAVQGGYDTHADQRPYHAQMLSSLGNAIAAFLNDLKNSGLADRVVVMCFSEFGRRIEENASEGTDHGTAGPVFIAGPRVRGGQYGSMPDLKHLSPDGDPQYTVDFRQIYGTLLSRWMDVDPLAILDEPGESLGFI